MVADKILYMYMHKQFSNIDTFHTTSIQYIFSIQWTFVPTNMSLHARDGCVNSVAICQPVPLFSHPYMFAV